jgi:peptidoglycan/LPS O-acetylase OafA/YrhL
MRRLWGTALLLALFTAAMWFAWLGWDHEYYKVNGVYQGPYRPWQVIGCGATVVAATVLAYLRVRTTGAVFVMAGAAAFGFAAPWSWDASSDDTGLWLVGLVFLSIGASVGLMVVLAVTHAVTAGRAAPGRPAPAARRP